MFGHSVSSAQKSHDENLELYDNELMKLNVPYPIGKIRKIYIKNTICKVGTILGA